MTCERLLAVCPAIFMVICALAAQDAGKEIS